MIRIKIDKSTFVQTCLKKKMNKKVEQINKGGKNGIYRLKFKKPAEMFFFENELSKQSRYS
jgi:hypothetical protein